jgi:hypothetical protein
MRGKNIIVVLPGVDATAEKLGASELGDSTFRLPTV